MCTNLTLKSQQRTKSVIKVIKNQTKMNLYLLDTYIHSPYYYHKRGKKISKENFSLDIGTSKIKVTVVKMLSYSYPYCALYRIYKCRCNSSCSFLATDSQRDALASFPLMEHHHKFSVGQGMQILPI